MSQFGSTIDLDNIIQQDDIAFELVRLYIDWDNRRRNWITEKAEIQKYVYATDTTKTTNAQLPWKNKTTVPKLCQIRDNLYANYTAALFPKNKWLEWEGATDEEQTKEKAEAIESLMLNRIERPEFKNEISKLIYDFIDYGNVIAGPEWIDETQLLPESNTEKIGYVGTVPKRYSPLDVVFNPVAPSFYRTGKFVRSMMTFGDFAAQLQQETPPDNQEAIQKIFQYMRDIRSQTTSFTGTYNVKNELLSVSGFTDFVQYLRSNYVEVLTFYGDFYDIHNNVFHKNKIITIVDRHRIVNMVDNPSVLGGDGLFHCGWRIRQDSLWAMGPLDNLVGMQYRIDHLENLKADVFDLIAAPPLAIYGNVDDFKWGPFERIYLGEDGKVEVLAPEGNVLNANLEIQNLMNLMEEMAGSPKEAAGFRTPGEKTAYEVQRLENAAARIFATKIKQFEEQILEPLLNAMLEMERRKMTAQTIRVFDSELNAAAFISVTKEDISGAGRIRPMAARNFAERAERVQNLNNFFQSTLGQDPDIKAHFSTVKLAFMFEDLLDVEAYELVMPYIRLSEQQEAQRLMNSGDEQTQMEAGTPSGLTPDDPAIDLGLPE
jgi:hypothetical protein